MRKENFVSLVLGVVGGLVFALGMCMCLIEEWGLFNQGVAVSVAGAAVLVAMVVVRRRMLGLEPVRLDGRAVLTLVVGLIGALVFGLGMVMTMSWGMMVPGIVVGITGIAILLALIPLAKGLR